MDIIPILTSVITGYFMGNLMASYFITKWVMGYDIREHGTGNAGGSNSFMLMGAKNGLIVGIIDNLKAFIAVYIIRVLYSSSQTEILPLLMMISGTMAVMGHIFPFFLGFKGGKGVACFMGMCLGINSEVGWFVILGIIILTIITDYVAIASIIGYLIFPLLLFFAPNYFFSTQSINNHNEIIAIGLALSLIGIWKHKINVYNLISGKEKGLRGVLKEKYKS